MTTLRNSLKIALVIGALTAGSRSQLSAQQMSSPKDSVRVSVAGATLAVDYSRPSKRGREIFGGLVPYNRVWRTGANEATHFRTDRDLVFGNVTVPAGVYTIYTLPSAAAWKLIINRQTEQWGTLYDAAQDLAKIDMKVGQLPATLEMMVIKIEPQGNGGVLKVQWDRTEASVAFTVKP